MRALVLLPLLLVVGLFACERTKTPPNRAGAGAPAAAAPAQPPSRVAKIVFIDKEKACPCTRDRVEQTWAALQSTLGTPPTLPVERLHIDTQAGQAETYTRSRPLMVPPGIYFVDAQGGVVDMLQGEIEAKEILALLKGR